MKLTVRLTIVSILVLILLGALYFLFPSKWQSVYYDLMNENPSINSVEEFRDIYNGFEKAQAHQLPIHYQEKSLLNSSKFQKLTQKVLYVVIPKRQVYQKVAGHVRWVDLICKDELFKNAGFWKNETVYCGINPKVVEKLILLQNALKEHDYDPNALTVKSGHRTPLKNQQAGGAGLSRHIAGEAIDIRIGDINQDGKYTDDDKQIVLDLCEKQIIKNEGGIGLYPGTRSVHIDVRGHRARWDSY
ncbi:MAG: DUF882 domain-containing protein [Bacteroidetes bacterium]|nr:DUF882 domain-containing protein [Bacteroidota bacterium]